MPLTTFIGLDLAWNTDKHSGIAVMTGDADQVSLQSVASGINSMEAIVAFIGAQSTANTVLAIDASLIVRNETGQRPCETLVSKAFGRYHAGCHTSNLVRPYATTGMSLVTALERQGFVHDFDMDTAKQSPGKWLFEVYPHPAMVRLFNLDRIIQYKKGPVGMRRAGLGRLRGYLKTLASGPMGLSSSSVLEELLRRDLEGLRGEALKRYEDTLDAVFCAYLAWHCWRWGAERNEVFGTMEEGYIVVPKCG